MTIDLAAHPLTRLLPDRAETTLGAQLDGYDPGALGDAAGLGERPYLLTNFATTVDGHAAIDGHSGSIGSDTDTAMLIGLRCTAEALMVGAGTLRAERYGRAIRDPEKRALRERRGLPPDPLTIVVSGRLELPWEAGLFSDGGGEVLIFTASSAEPPETATPVRVVRHEGGVDLGAALAHLRGELGIRSVLCEGGPHLHADLLAAGLVDELFLTFGPRLSGGTGPHLSAGLAAGVIDLELAWLLAAGSELFARYRVAR